jgi:integrase
MTHSQYATAENRVEPHETVEIDQQLIDGFTRVLALEGKRRKALKGSVVVYADKGWLRLRWSWGGRRYFLPIGLPDTQVNRTVAERKAKTIERDILTEQFDPTLTKYKTQASDETLTSAVELFENFINSKSKNVDPKTLDKYWGLLGYLRQHFRQKKALHISEEDACDFRDWLLKRIAPVTVKERLGLLKACWNWGLKRGKVRENPWFEVKLKVPPKQKPNPFTREEVKQILEGFKADPTYNYYSDFAEFLLSVGCRIGEAAGLKWRHLSDDCSVIWVGESWSRGRQKATKTNRDRTFELSPRIQQMLLARRPESFNPNDWVFMSSEGKPVDDHNFRNRAWKPILKRVGVAYRMPRNSRHTFTSQAIDQGLHPTEVSEITGHSVQTLYRHYLGGVRGRAKLPELLE